MKIKDEDTIVVPADELFMDTAESPTKHFQNIVLQFTQRRRSSVARRESLANAGLIPNAQVGATLEAGARTPTTAHPRNRHSPELERLTEEKETEWQVFDFVARIGAVWFAIAFLR